MKPKTGLILNSVLLALDVLLIILVYALEKPGIGTQICIWLIPWSPVCGIVHFAQQKKKQIV